MTASSIPQTNSLIRGESVLGGIDKIKRYKWNEIGKPGEFTLIDKGELHVDHSYQRDKINEARINDIASNWTWIQCGALSVSERDGKWFVMDGQHRKLAADKRSDIKELPCMVYPLESAKIEAAAFVSLNSQKTSVAGIDRFKAMVVAGDATAIGLQQVLASTGHKASACASSKGVGCILLLWKMFKRDDKKLRLIWPLIADVCSGTIIVDTLVRAISGTESVANEKGLSLTEQPFRAAMIQAGGAMLTAEIRREIGIAGKGGERIETAALMRWLNRQRLGPKNKLPI